MSIIVHCPSCRIRLTLGDDRKGQTFGCPKCSTTITAPDTDADVRRYWESVISSPDSGPDTEREGSAQGTESTLKLRSFYYNHLPLSFLDSSLVSFHFVRIGTLTAVEKTVRTYVSGGGIFSYTDSSGHVHTQGAPIRTSHETTTDMWILGDDGHESSLRIQADIPLKVGHRISVVASRFDGSDSSHVCLVVNETAGEFSILEGWKEAPVAISATEWVCIFVAYLWVLVFLLVGFLSNPPLAVACWLVSLVVGKWCLEAVADSIRRRLVRHCYNLAATILDRC